MKKLLIFMAAAVCLSLPTKLGAADNDAILDKIEAACSSLNSAQASFTHVRTTAAKTSSTQEGTMYFSTPGMLSMVYSEDLFIINGNLVYTRRGGKANRVDTAKVPSMRNLSTTLIQGISGKIRDVVEANNADCAVEEKSGEYIVTLTAKAKAARGYSKIILTFRKSDCMVVSLETVEFSGMVNLYTLSDIHRNAAVDSSVFVIPSK